MVELRAMKGEVDIERSFLGVLGDPNLGDCDKLRKSAFAWLCKSVNQHTYSDLVVDFLREQMGSQDHSDLKVFGYAAISMFPNCRAWEELGDPRIAELAHRQYVGELTAESNQPTCAAYSECMGVSEQAIYYAEAIVGLEGRRRMALFGEASRAKLEEMEEVLVAAMGTKGAGVIGDLVVPQWTKRLRMERLVMSDYSESMLWEMVVDGKFLNYVLLGQLMVAGLGQARTPQGDEWRKWAEMTRGYVAALCSRYEDVFLDFPEAAIDRFNHNNPELVAILKRGMELTEGVDQCRLLGKAIEELREDPSCSLWDPLASALLGDFEGLRWYMG